MKIRVLTVDDDPNILSLLQLVLESEQLLEEHTFHLAIVDVMMPGKNGHALCKEIRELYDIPIILLTALAELEDKEAGYAAGTDDYLVKPFEPKELLFRMKALLRRYQLVSDLYIRFPNTLIDRAGYTVTIQDQPIMLPRKEFEILALLASYPGRIFTRDQLLNWVWGSEYEGDSRTIDVHIKRLRERLHPLTDDFRIVTIRGLGYKLEAQER